MEGIIIGISEVKNKTYNFNGRNVSYDMRYIRVVTPDEGEILVRLTDNNFSLLPRDKDGNRTQLKNGDIANFETFDKEFLFKETGGVMRTNPKIVTVLSHITETSVEKYLLQNITFYDWGVELKNESSICKIPKESWEAQTNIETSFTLNKYKAQIPVEELKEAYVELQANFKIYYRWNLNNKFKYFNNGEQVLIVSENLLPLRKVKADEEEVIRTRLLIEEIKQFLQNQMFVTYDNILALAQKYTMPEQDINEYVRSIVWKKDYDEEYTNFLKTKSKQVLYGTDGLFYCLPNNITILEDPSTGKATYVFIGSPNYIASQIEALKQENINANNSSAWRELLYRLKKSTPEKTTFFVGRIVHFDKDQWFRDMDVIINEATGLSPSITKTIPEDPTKRRSTTSQFLSPKQKKYAVEVYSCKVCHEYPIKIHVRLPSKVTVDGDTKHCPNCNARETELTFEKAYETNKNGEIIE